MWETSRWAFLRTVELSSCSSAATDHTSSAACVAGRGQRSSLDTIPSHIDSRARTNEYESIRRGWGLNQQISDHHGSKESETGIPRTQGMYRDNIASTLCISTFPSHQSQYRQLNEQREAVRKREAQCKASVAKLEQKLRDMEEEKR